jgi:hypothetical protein
MQQAELINNFMIENKTTFKSFLPAILGLLAMLMLYNWENIKINYQTRSFGCDNIDDCVSKYKFEEARKYAALITDNSREKKYWNDRTSKEAFLEIIIKETEFWINQGELEKAKITARELISYLNYKVETYKKYCSFLLDIVKKYCSKQQFKKALELAIDLPEKSISEEKEEYIYSGASAKEHYDGLKKKLMLNQQIDVWKGGGHYYKITTYEYPQKQALKIIEEFKGLSK